MLFRCDGPIPSSVEEIDFEAMRVFESYEEVKAILSEHLLVVSWNDQQQLGTVENEIGRFEFQCYQSLISAGTVGLKTSFRQSVEESQGYISDICKKAGLFGVDEQSLQIIR